MKQGHHRLLVTLFILLSGTGSFAEHGETPKPQGPTSAPATAQGKKAFRPLESVPGNEQEAGSDANLRKKFIDFTPYATYDEAIAATYPGAEITFIPTDNVQVAIREAFGQKISPGIDAMTVSPILKKGGTGKLSVSHLVFLDKKLFADPAKLIVAQS